jgi:nucleolin
MAKDKKSSKAAAPVKVSESVKSGRVTKPAEKAKAVSSKVEKLSKKVKKAPTPESSDDDSEEDATSESSDSSDEEEEVKPKTNGSAKVNGHAKAAAKDDDSEDDSSEEEEDSDSNDEAPPAKKAAAPKVNGKANGHVNGKSAKDSDDSEEDSDDSEDDEEDKAAADDDDSSDDSSDDDEEEEEKAPVADSKKRKAETAAENTPKKSKVDEEATEGSANLFVGNLSWNVDEEWLSREFEEFGEIKGVRIITDRESGRSKGFGYVEFHNVADAQKALAGRQGYLLDNRELRVDNGDSRPQQTPQQKGFDRASKYGDVPKPPSTTIFVGNVSFNADENALSEVFAEYGTIKAVRLPTDRDTGAIKGFAYVEMSSIEEAQAAHEALQGADIAGRNVRLDFASERTNDGGDRGGRGGGGRGFGGGRGGGRGGRGGFGDRGGRGGGRGFGGGRGGGRGGSTNRGGFGDFSGKKITF